MSELYAFWESILSGYVEQLVTSRMAPPTSLEDTCRNESRGASPPLRGVYVQHTIAKDLERYIEGLVIPQGRFAGQPFRLFPWQKRFLRGAFGQPDDAALTLGRGGGKTTFIAAIGAACVDGPLVEPNSESLIVASSFDQGLIAWRHVLRLLGPGPGP